MSKFPEQLELTIVDDLFANYTLGYESEGYEVLVYCENCSGVVCTIEQNEIKHHTTMDLYEEIILQHRNQSPIK